MSKDNEKLRTAIKGLEQLIEFSASIDDEGGIHAYDAECDIFATFESIEVATSVVAVLNAAYDVVYGGDV